MEKKLSLSTRQRDALHHLLHRNLRKCSSATLDAFVRLGWILDVAGGFELTEAGRRIAELSEQAPRDRAIEIPLHPMIIPPASPQHPAATFSM